jgi:hypothetical protein
MTLICEFFVAIDCFGEMTGGGATCPRYSRKGFVRWTRDSTAG